MELIPVVAPWMLNQPYIDEYILDLKMKEGNKMDLVQANCSNVKVTSNIYIQMEPRTQIMEKLDDYITCHLADAFYPKRLTVD